MKKITFLFIALPFIALGQVSTPDVNFETELIAQGIDTDGVVNGQISNADALAKTGTLNVNNLNISDLTGIEAFTNITRLYCEDNNLTTLDISTLTGLTHVRCQNNSLSALNTTNNVALRQIRVQNNNIAALTLTTNIALEQLRASYNTIGTLTVTDNIALTQLRVRENNLNAIDVSLLSNLDDLRIQGNNLTTLDVSNNTVLTQLRSQGNNLTSLDARNGNNLNMTFFSCSNNASLTCIDVDDVAFADANFLKPAGAVFSTDCATLSVDSVDLDESISIFPIPTHDYINIKSRLNIEAVSVIDVNGKIVIETKSTEKLDVSTLKTGVYFIKIDTENGTLVKPFIKR